jgi:hypothetical protein
MNELNQIEILKEIIFHFDHEIIAKIDKFIIEMPCDKWFRIGEDKTKLAVIKDWIEKDCLKGYYLTLSEDYKSFIKRSVK